MFVFIFDDCFAKTVCRATALPARYIPAPLDVVNGLCSFLRKMCLFHMKIHVSVYVVYWL